MDGSGEHWNMLLEGAQMALAAITAGTMGFLKEKKIDIHDWVDYLGEGFSGALVELEDRGLDEVMSHLLGLEILPLGAEVILGEMTPERAEVTLTPLPNRRVLKKFGTSPGLLFKQFGISEAEFESFYDLFEPAAAAIGLNFTHGMKGGQELLLLEKDNEKKKSAI